MKVKYRGDEVEVTYETYGFYSPATRFQPAEYPDIFIEDVEYQGVSIFKILSDNDIEEILESLIADIEY